MSLIEIKELNFCYENANSSAFSLKISEFDINCGDFISLLGPNGCGKSTFLKLISRLLTYKEGSVKISGREIKNISQKEYAKSIAYVPQSTYSIFPFSVYEIVMMGRTPYLGIMGFESQADRIIVNEALDLLEITHLKRKGINEISGGEAQRVFIARALAQRAQIILLDEPNAHLDIEHQIGIFNLLTKLNTEQGLTIISVSHDLNLVGIFSKEIAFMVNGKIVQKGGKSTVLTEDNIRNIFNVETAVYYSQKNDAVNVLINPLIK